LVNVKVQFEFIAIAVIFVTTCIRLISIKLQLNLPKVET